MRPGLREVVHPEPPYPCLRLRVKAVKRVTGGWARVILSGPELRGFSLTGIACWVKLFICGPAGDTGRTYTVREFDAAKGELSLDVVRRRSTNGMSQWIYEHLHPGDWVDIAGPKGGYQMGHDRDWHLFLGDETALPAIYCLVSAVPERSSATAIVEVPFPEYTYSAARGIEFLVRGDAAGREHSFLDSAIETLERRPGRGRVWIAGEAGLVRRLKERAGRMFTGSDVTIEATGYWKAGHQNYRDLTPPPS